MRVDLYKFDDSGVISTFTSGNRIVSFDGDDYIPVPIGRGDIMANPSLHKAALDVTISLKNSTAREWLTTPSLFAITLTVYTKTDNDTPIVAWRGRVVNRTVKSLKLKLKVDSTFTTLQRKGLRKRFQRTCPYALYGKGCELDKALFSDAVTIQSQNATDVVVTGASAQVDGYYTGGILEDSEGVLHFITEHEGDNLTLLKARYIKAGVSGILYAGCDRSVTTCSVKFNNLANFGGYPYIPTKNPFSGSSIA